MNTFNGNNVNCGCKEFENPPGFATMEKVKTYVDGWKVQKKNFGRAYGIEPYTSHCKILLNHLQIDYTNFENTPSKPGKLWPWQVY